MKYLEARTYVLERLQNELSPQLYYHDVYHTFNEVLHWVCKLSKKEGVSGDSLILLKTAALYHDIGFVQKYENNESLACDVAKETLPNFGYKVSEVVQVTELILNTQIPQRPSSLLGKILCDADLANLGLPSFSFRSDLLYKELQANGSTISPEEWRERQLLFLSEHFYHTASGIELLTPGKLENMKDLQIC